MHFPSSFTWLCSFFSLINCYMTKTRIFLKISQKSKLPPIGISYSKKHKNWLIKIFFFQTYAFPSPFSWWYSFFSIINFLVEKTWIFSKIVKKNFKIWCKIFIVFQVFPPKTWKLKKTSITPKNTKENVSIWKKEVFLWVDF